MDPGYDDDIQQFKEKYIMLNNKKILLMKNDNHGALRKIVTDYFMPSNDIDHIIQRSGIYIHVVLLVRVFRFCHTLLN